MHHSSNDTIRKSNGTAARIDDQITHLQNLQLQAKSEDELLSKYESQIGLILEIADLLQTDDRNTHKSSIGNNDVKEIVHQMYRHLNNGLPMPSMASITSLAIQLLKLRLLEAKLRCDCIAKAKELTAFRVTRLQEKQMEKERNVDSLRMNLLKLETLLISNYESQMLTLESTILEFGKTKINQVKMQASKAQMKNLKILLDTTFQFKVQPQPDSQSRVQSQSHNQSKENRKNIQLTFNHQPILLINEFLGYSLPMINQFIEQLITLQKQLCVVLDVKLPYIDALSKYIPSTKFYDLLKKKELISTGQQGLRELSLSGNIYGDGDNDIDIDIDNNNDSRGKVVGGNNGNDGRIVNGEFNPVRIENTAEKVVKLGNAYQLPLSSKTLNFQRRVARSNSIEPGELDQIPTIIKEYSSTPTSSPDSVPLLKKITIPHRIINKPFNKLSIKDFFEFLVIIVKVVINFEVLLRLANASEGYSEEIDIVNSCDFTKILMQVSKLDSRWPWHHRVMKAATAPQEPTNPTKPTELTKLTTESEEKEKSPNVLVKDIYDQHRFQDWLEHIYNSIIYSLFAKKHHNKPVALHNLNFKNLFINQPKPDQQRDDWDIISEML